MCAGDARALLGDGLLGDLHQNLLPGLEQVADGGQVGGLHGVATMAAAVVSEAPAAFAGAAGVARTVTAISTVAAATPAIAASIAASWAAFRIASALLTGTVGSTRLLPAAVRLFRLAKLRLEELSIGSGSAAGCLFVELARLL